VRGPKNRELNRVDGKYFSYTQEFAVTATYHWDHLFDRIKRTNYIKEGNKMVTLEKPAVA